MEELASTEERDRYMEAYQAALRRWSRADRLLNRLDFESHLRPGDLDAEIAAEEARKEFEAAREQFDLMHIELVNRRVTEAQHRELDALELGQRLDALIITMNALVDQLTRLCDVLAEKAVGEQ